jgi:hypothetical protein
MVVADTRIQAEELPLDPLVAPPGVLPGQTEHEVANIRIDGRPAGRAMRPGPLPPREVSVPPEQGLRPHQEDSPPFTREQPAHSRQEGSVARPVDGAPYPSPQDREFVPEDQDLQVLGRTRNGYEAPPARAAARAPHRRGTGARGGILTDRPGCDHRRAQSRFCTPRLSETDVANPTHPVGAEGGGAPGRSAYRNATTSL